MTTSENATQKAIALPTLSVHHTSFLWALCQAFVLSIIQRCPACKGAGWPLLAIWASRPSTPPLWFRWIKSLQFLAGIFHTEAPIHCCSLLVAFFLPRCYLSLEHPFLGYTPSSYALPTESTENSISTWFNQEACLGV
jgi:hypothetical protein